MGTIEQNGVLILYVLKRGKGNKRPPPTKTAIRVPYLAKLTALILTYFVNSL